MAKNPPGNKKLAPIIVKKIVKGGGHHGGSWKVAYADFVTAMMAFFLLMWLINSTTEETKEGLAGYFKEFSIFDNPPPSALPSDASEMTPPSAVVGARGDRPDVPAGKSRQEEIEDMLRKTIEERLSDIKDQIHVKIEEDKVRVDLVDKAGRELFALGRAEMNPDGQRVLDVIGEALKDQGVQMAIEGHTDSRQYGGAQYTNWELSSDRAGAARRELARIGFPNDDINMVAGFADKNPFNPDDALDPRNRRITLLLTPPPSDPEVREKVGIPGEGAGAGGTGQGTGAAKPAETPAPPKPGDPSNIIEKEIEKVYDKGTKEQFDKELKPGNNGQ